MLKTLQNFRTTNSQNMILHVFWVNPRILDTSSWFPYLKKRFLPFLFCPFFGFNFGFSSTSLQEDPAPPPRHSQTDRFGSGCGAQLPPHRMLLYSDTPRCEGDVGSGWVEGFMFCFRGCRLGAVCESVMFQKNWEIVNVFQDGCGGARFWVTFEVWLLLIW